MKREKSRRRRKMPSQSPSWLTDGTYQGCQTEAAAAICTTDHENAVLGIRSMTGVPFILCLFVVTCCQSIAVSRLLSVRCCQSVVVSRLLLIGCCQSVVINQQPVLKDLQWHCPAVSLPRQLWDQGH